MALAEFFKWLFEQFQHYILPFIIIPIYERGVMLRLGRNPKLFPPGFHFKIPFIDDFHTCIITVDTMSTHAVHVTTRDGKTITVTPVIEFLIDDPIKWIMETNDAITNLHDIARGEVADFLTDIDFADCMKRTTATQIKNKLSKKVEDMGAKVQRLILADCCITRVYITQI